MKGYLILFLYILGLFLPNSTKGLISSDFEIGSNIVLLLVLIYFIYTQKKVDLMSFYIVILINSSLWLSTLLTQANLNSFGTSISFMNLSLLLCLDFKELKISKKSYKYTFFLTNIINIALGMLIVFDNANILEFIKNYYSAFYDDLLLYMLSSNKPVNTLASHSLAGFYHFIFFILNILSYKKSGKNIYLIMSIFYMILLWFLSSNTAYLFLGISFIIFVFILFYKNKILLLFSLFVVFVEYLFNVESVNHILLNLFTESSNVFKSRENGILSRYSNSGNLINNYVYLKENYFVPVGFGNYANLKYGDSGIVEYLLRGSIICLLSILIGFYIFLKRNLGKKYAVLIFILFVSFEVGFSNFIYFRTLLVLPFLIVYLKLLLKNDAPITKEI